MTAQTKGRIRHVALSVKDPWETAEFYKQALGLEEVVELDGPLAEGVFLTDGVVNLAILHFKSDEASQGTGVDFVGIHHIGFWVDDVVEQGKIARNTGATWIMGDTNNPHGYEISTPTSTASSSTSPPTAGPVRRRTRDRKTTSPIRTRDGGWRSSTSAARGPRRSSPRCVRKRSPRPPSDALTDETARHCPTALPTLRHEPPPRRSRGGVAVLRRRRGQAHDS